ncbi:hypothetical protein [Neptuniibacter sp.]|uniref:hypothetical protein n=1 Tax=Neptuniibacter sp. TaxID=1962643 RepID=UPI003B5B5E17
MTNLENTWCDSGCIIVNAFNFDGSYHNTYMTTMTHMERGEMTYDNSIFRCLHEGIGVSEINRFIGEFPKPTQTGWS